MPNDYDKSLSDSTEVDEKLKNYLEILSYSLRYEKPDTNKQSQLVVEAMGMRTMRQLICFWQKSLSTLILTVE